MGILLLPRLSPEAEIATGQLTALPLAETPHRLRRISAVYRRDKYLSGAMQAFLKRLRVTLPPQISAGT
jgi:DNA-binding transcriptional LysR family regulator